MPHSLRSVVTGTFGGILALQQSFRSLALQHQLSHYCIHTVIKESPNDVIMWTTVISAVIAENLARNSNEYQHLKKIYNNDNKPKDLIVLVFLFVPIIVLCIALIKQ